MAAACGALRRWVTDECDLDSCRRVGAVVVGPEVHAAERAAEAVRGRVGDVDVRA